MGTSGNGDGWPDNGGPHDELPGLPPEWGSIVIPDDPAELAAEAALVRHELRQQKRRATWRRRLGLAPTSGGSAIAPLRLPLLIMTVALLATLASLFSVVWPAPQRQPVAPRTAPSNTNSRTLPGLDLVAEDGTLVPLHSLLPAVIIMIDDCACADQVAAAVRSVPSGVRVVTLVSGRSTPTPTPAQPTGPTAVRALTDPDAKVRGLLGVGHTPGAAPALFTARSGEVVRTLPSAESVSDYPAELSRLGSR